MNERKQKPVCIRLINAATSPFLPHGSHLEDLIQWVFLGFLPHTQKSHSQLTYAEDRRGNVSQRNIIANEVQQPIIRINRYDGLALGPLCHSIATATIAAPVVVLLIIRVAWIDDKLLEGDDDTFVW